MTLPSQGAIDVIATKILFDAKEAIMMLQGWNNSITTSAEKMAFFKSVIQAVAKSMNGDLKAATAAVQGLARAANINPAGISKIGKDLQLIDSIAQKSLGGVGAKSAEASARITLLSNAIQAMATRGKVSIDQVTSSLRTLNASAGTKFGKLGFSDANISQAGEAARKTAASVQGIGTAAEGAGKKAEGAFGRVVNATNIMRIAIGAVVSMILFQLIQAVTQFTKGAIKEFAELEDTMFRIRAVEKELSEGGIEISTKGLKDGIKEVKDQLKVFSEEDVAKLVGKVAISTKDLKFKDQEKDVIALAKAIGILNIRSTENEDITQTSSKVITALLSGKTQGISGLGLQMNDVAIKAKAIELGFLDAGDAVTELSKKEKDITKIQIVLDSAATEEGLFNEYLDTNSAKIKENSAAWDDFKVAAGGFFASAIPSVTKLLELFTASVNGVKSIIIFYDVGIQVIKKFVEELGKTLNPIKAFQNTMAQIGSIFDKVASEEVPSLFAEMPDDAPEWFKNAFGEFIVDAETATGALEDLGEVDMEETEEALIDIDEKIQDIIIDAKQAQEDLDLDFSQKRSDINVEYDRKADDAAQDHADKLVDINQDARDKIEDAKNKAREEEKKAEMDLLQKLKELRQRFLMDLEDALHARDARQILRLIREYNFDKQNLLDKKKLDEQARKDTLEQELRDIELDRQRKIAQEQIDYRRKLDDLALNKQREIDELNIWYAREQEDIQRNVEQKLEKLLAGYIAEEKIHAEQQAVIQGILAKYFGEDMAMVDRLAAYMSGRFAQMAAGAASVANLAGMATYQASERGSAPASPFAGLFGGGGSSSSSTSTRRPTAPAQRIPRYAEGGTLFARQPTLALFGEKSPEFAQFTPLSQMGQTGGGSFSGGGSKDGELVLDVSLSPDLEAKIVRNTLSKTANIVTKISRSKS